MLAEQLGYQPFGPLKSLTWGNGLTLSRSFDQSYRLTGQQVGSWSSDYAFDANGNITGLDQSLWGSLQYGYDALDRLSLEQKSAEKKTYVYDATGNRTARVTYSLANGVQTQTAKQSLTYNGNSNRLNKRSTSYAVEVDIAGHYTRYSQNRRYTYNEQGRLSTVTDADGGLMATYSYNALGQRVLKTLPSGASWTFLYGPDGQLLGQEQYSASTGKKLKGQYWVWLDAMPLAGLELSFNSAGAVNSSNLYYLHADHLNTPRLASNQNQALIWSWASDAFGVGAANPDVDGNGIATDIPLRFPGQQYDAHSALHYNYFRDYDPETGRYVESDPIGLGGGLNTYGYVEGNPLSSVDFLGLMGSAGNPREASRLTMFSRKISECLCKISPRFCINPRDIIAGSPGFGGFWPQIIGINPAGQTNFYGKSIISEDLYGSVISSPDGFPSVMDLTETVAHESLHQTQETPLRRLGYEDPEIERQAMDVIRIYRQEILDCLNSRCGIRQ